tara:strand:- start:268 stop:501 length:234 start_codon:yes stop_codon:yes gene_type:complete
MLSRKYYKGLAGAMKAAYEEAAASSTDVEERMYTQGINFAYDRMVEYLASDNPRFNEEKFHAACVPDAPVQPRGRVW